MSKVPLSLLWYQASEAIARKPRHPATPGKSSYFSTLKLRSSNKACGHVEMAITTAVTEGKPVRNLVRSFRLDVQNLQPTCGVDNPCPQYPHHGPGSLEAGPSASMAVHRFKHLGKG